MRTSRLFLTAAFALSCITPRVFAQESSAVPDLSSPMTRAEFTRVIVDTLVPEAEEWRKICFRQLSPSQYTLLFVDVSIEEDYAPELCIAMIMGLVQGYEDGTFRPDRIINFVEAAKILTRAMALSPNAGHETTVPWYKGYVDTLALRGAIPDTITRFDQAMTYEDLSEIVSRLQEGATWLPSIDYRELEKRTAAMHENDA